MKGKIIKTDKEWMVEIQSDLHGYGIGWGDPMIYPLFITDENIWEGKEVEVEPIQYDSNFLPVIVKIKTNNMKPKTFEELFAGSGIEPTKDENGGVHYNFNATLKNKPMKLYTENQLQEAYNRGLMDGRLNNVDYSIPDGFTPIELPSDEEIEKIAEKESEVQGWGKYDGTSEQCGIKQAFINGAKLIFNQKNSNHQEVTSDTPSNYQRGWNAAQRGLLQNDAWGDTYTDNANNRPSHEELDEWIKGWKAYRHSNEIAKN